MANRKSIKNIDPASAASLSFNEASGAQKNMEVGSSLKPIMLTPTSYTTDTTTARRLAGKGKNLAVYNNHTAVAAITLGDSSGMAALASGAVDTSGNVGIPCAPGAWTHIACNDRQFVKGETATLLVFVIEDDTSVA